jgi:hypothetical protein
MGQRAFEQKYIINLAILTRMFAERSPDKAMREAWNEAQA